MGVKKNLRVSDRARVADIALEVWRKLRITLGACHLTNSSGCFSAWTMRARAMYT